MLFLALKKVRMVKMNSPQIPTTGGRGGIPPPLNSIWQTQTKHLFKKCAPKNTLMPPVSRIGPDELASFLS